jgi:hypothetical protein
MAESFAKSRFLLAAIEYGQNDAEMEALLKIADGIKCTIKPSATGVTLSVDYNDKDQGNYLEIIEEGMPAPYAGGDGGIVHNPDGTFEKSDVDPRLWGTRLDFLAKPGSDTLAEVNRMLADLFRDEVETIVSESRPEIAAIAKDYVMRELREVMQK